jgi:integrase
MPRKPSVCYFPTRNAYYCQIRKVQHHLATGPDDRPAGPTYRAAHKKFMELLQEDAIEEAGDANTVRTVLDAYLDDCKARLKASTLKTKSTALRPFVAALGGLRVDALSLLRVNAFLRAQREPRTHERQTKKGSKSKRVTVWCESTCTNFVKTASAAFHWAVRAKLISRNPLLEVDAPAIRSRSRDCLISSEQHATILAGLRSRGLRDLLIALENTGARPGELTAARGADWEDALGAIVYYGDDRRRLDEFRHKTAGKGKDRVILFTGTALERVRQRAKAGPGAILFPNRDGRPFGDKCVQSSLWHIKRRFNLPGFSAVSYRHTFATNWLKAGKSIEILAELLGNTPETIRKHYAHLCSDREGIRRHLEAFRAETS